VSTHTHAVSQPFTPETSPRPKPNLRIRSSTSSRGRWMVRCVWRTSPRTR